MTFFQWHHQILNSLNSSNSMRIMEKLDCFRPLQLLRRFALTFTIHWSKASPLYTCQYAQRLCNWTLHLIKTMLNAQQENSYSRQCVLGRDYIMRRESWICSEVTELFFRWSSFRINIKQHNTTTPTQQNEAVRIQNTCYIPRITHWELLRVYQSARWGVTM